MEVCLKLASSRPADGVTDHRKVPLELFDALIQKGRLALLLFVGHFPSWDFLGLLGGQGFTCNHSDSCSEGKMWNCRGISVGFINGSRARQVRLFRPWDSSRFDPLPTTTEEQDWVSRCCYISRRHWSPPSIMLGTGRASLAWTELAIGCRIP